MNFSDNILSIKEAALTARVSEDTVRQYIELGILLTNEKQGILKTSLEEIFQIKTRDSTKKAPLHIERKEEDLGSMQEPPSREALTNNSNGTLHEDYVLLREKSTGPSFLKRENNFLKEKIKMLEEERNWLRQRLEFLETRSERDQVLLLSKSETVRQLSLQKSPPGPISRLFGFRRAKDTTKNHQTWTNSERR